MDIKKPIIIAGPCAAESREQVLETARALSKGDVTIYRAGLWKPRTKPGDFEGVGEKGLEWLSEVKSKFGMKIATEVASPEHVVSVLKHNVDILWLGARTVANPFAVQAIADALKGQHITVMIKNPINPDINLWLGAIERIQKCGIENIVAIHRGFSSYEKQTYRNMPVWAIPLELKRVMPSISLLCDPSHIGGKRELIAPLCQQALDLNYDGLFIESHCCPDCALSDAAQQLLPGDLISILNNLTIKTNVDISENIFLYRDKIDEIDNRILELLAERMSISQEIGKIKIRQRATLFQSSRYDQLLKNRVEIGEKFGLSHEFVEQVVKQIHQESIKKQLELDE